MQYYRLLSHNSILLLQRYRTFVGFCHTAFELLPNILKYIYILGRNC